MHEYYKRQTFIRNKYYKYLCYPYIYYIIKNKIYYLVFYNIAMSTKNK